MEEKATNTDNFDNFVYARDNEKRIFVGNALLIMLIMGFCCLFFISLGTLIYSEDYSILAIAGAVFSLVSIAINLFLVCRSVMYLKFCRRYDIYKDLLKGRRSESITFLADCVNKTEEKVIKDLTFAVKQKLIPQGYFDDDRGAFITTEESMKELTEWLISMRDEAYSNFQIKSVPTLPADQIIGVRPKFLRKAAEQLAKMDEGEIFLKKIPHVYFEENQLHALIICEENDFNLCLKKVDSFLPYIDNWVTSDQLSPPVFELHKTELIPVIERWISSDYKYTIRFAIRELKDLYLDEEFNPKYVEWVAQVCSNEYYVNMMVATYFAAALSKQYYAVLPYLTENRLSVWVHNKVIQKAKDNVNIPEDRKEYLKTLKR